jgi:hypothetical protein
MSSFDKHNPLINRYAQKCWKNMVDMIMMVVLSIQQPWHSVGMQMHDYRDKGAGSRFVWGNKRSTLIWLASNGEQLYYEALECLEFTGKKRSLALMNVFLQVPGLGLAKAGFCCQLFAGCVGCIDVHNLRRLSIPVTVLKLNKNASAVTKQKRIETYVDACSQRRCRWLWNSWCNLIAKKQPERWRDGEHVSLVHYEYLNNRSASA